jgi:hypothetical protein
MDHEQRRRDLDETDQYDVGMFPAPRPQPIAPAAPAPQRPHPLQPPAASDRPHGGAQPSTWVVPAASPAVAHRPPSATWPTRWEAPYDTSALAVLAATTLLVFGIIGAIGFGFALAVWDAVARLSLGTLIQLQTVESTRIVLMTLLVVAIVQVVAAIGVFAHRRWARLVSIAICVPWTMAATLLLVAATSRGLVLETWLGGVLLAAFGFSFFGLIAGNSHFRRLARRY